MAFPFESLIVYKRSLAFVQVTERLVQRLKNKASYTLRDQLSRASVSIPLNIAEGCGRWGTQEKRRFGRIALGSAFECLSVIEVLHLMEHIDGPTYEAFYAQIEEISKMLTSWIKALNERKNLRPR